MTRASHQLREPLSESLAKCVYLDRLAAAKAEALTKTPWWCFRDRRAARRSTEHWREVADVRWAALPENAVQIVAHDDIAEAWIDVRRDKPQATHRNPFHPEVLAQMAWLSQTVSARLQAMASTTADAEIAKGDIPGYLELVTAEAVESYARTIVGERTGMAAHDRIMAVMGFEDGRQNETIQHVASGLRAQVWWDEQGIGTIYSKSDQILSIDPNRPGVLDTWEEVIGLGIGTKLYALAARRHPHIRWNASAPSDAAQAVRAKLHNHDPWRWNAACQWCDSHDIAWLTATPADFAGHPVTP